MSLEDGGSGNANDELQAQMGASATGTGPSEGLSGVDQQIVSAGERAGANWNRYTLRDINSRLEENVSFLQEVRDNEIGDIPVGNWFDDVVRKTQYPRWVGIGSRRFTRARIAGDIERNRFNYRNVAVNGVVFYTLAQTNPVQRSPLSQHSTLPLTEEGEALTGIYDNAESIVLQEEAILNGATGVITQFKELVDSAGIDPTLPENVRTSVMVSQPTNLRGVGGGLSEAPGGSDEGLRTTTVSEWAPRESTGLLRQAQVARDTYYDHMLWLYYVRQSQNTIQVSFDDTLDVAAQLADVYKDARVHQYIAAAIGIIEAERSEAEELSRQAARAEDQGRLDDARSLRSQAEDIEAGLDGRLDELLEELVEAGAGEDESDLTDAQLSQQRRLAEQTFLLDFLDIYAGQNQARNEKYLTDDGDPHFIMVHGPTDTIVNELMYDPSMEELDKIKTSELSGLVPKIKLFKSSFLPTEDYLMGREIKHEIPFKTHIREGEIASMLNSNFDRGQGAGIKKFEWRLEGRDPFSSRRDIFARLELYFQSMDEFIKHRGAPNARYVDNGEEYDDRDNPLKFRYVDLVNIGMAHPGRAFIWNPDYYKIEAELGWYLPGGTGDASTFLSNSMREAINASTMFLHLSAFDHDIKINDEGNVTLTIEYLAFQEGVYLGPDSDILSTPERRADRLHALKVLTDTKSGTNCPDTYIADLEEAYRNKVRDQNVQSWSRMLNSLYDRDRVFYTKLDTSLLDVYLAGSRAAAAQPLLEELGLRGSVSNFDVEANSNVGDGPTTEAITNRVPSTLDGSDLEDAESVLESLKGLTYQEDDDSYYLQFFYFGDLLEAALEIVHTDVSPTDNSYGAVSRLKNNSRILLGPISYKLNVRTEDDPPQYNEKLIYNISLADIPISVHYFIDWFLTKVVAQERTIYPVLSFIREVTSDLIANAMRSQGGERNVAKQNLQLRTNFFTAAGDGRGGHEKLLSLRNIPDAPDSFLMAGRGSELTPEQQELYRPSTEELGAILSGDETAVASAIASRVDLETLPRAQRPVLKPPENQAQKSYDYMLVYAINTGAVHDLKGDETNDKERGIYHFGIGKPEGIIKRITFSKSDIPFLREARLEEEFLGQMTGLAVLANVYNVTVECYGTTMFWPGMKIYINPLGLSPNFGNPSIRGSASNVLGIGGYHVITKVHSYIERGLYVTKLTAIWESGGASLADARDAEEENNVTNEECPATRREISSMIINMR